MRLLGVIGEEAGAERLGGRPVSLVGDVGVDVEGHAYVGMAEAVLGDLDVGAFEDQGGGVRSAQIVEAGALDAGGGDRAEEVRRFRRVRHLIEGLVPGGAVADSLSGGGASAEEPRVVEALISPHELFVNDSPQSSYLPLPSLVLPARRLPSAVGRSLQHDLQLLTPLLEDPERPLVAVLGGNRPFLRLHGLEGLVLRADKVLLGGTMAPPMLRAIGRQPPDGAPEDFLAECRAVYGLGARVDHRSLEAQGLARVPTHHKGPAITALERRGIEPST